MDYEHILENVTIQDNDNIELDLLELCCEENSILTETVKKLGGNAERAGLFNGCDLLKADGRAKIKKIIEERRPRWIWISFPCGATSPIQNLNEITDYGWYQSQRRKQKSRRLVKFGYEVLEDHVRNGGGIVQEWPRYNAAWNFPEVKAFWDKLNYSDHNLDGCMFNLRAPDGNHHKKPWTLRCNRPGVMSKMERLCDGSHHHSPSMGGNVAKKTGLYTQQLCSMAVKCMRSYFVSDLDIFGMDSIKIDREALKTMTLQELERLSLTVLELHRRCGHPGNRALVKILAARNADPKMLAMQSNFTVPKTIGGSVIGEGRKALEHLADGRVLLQAWLQCLPLPGDAG